jgi:hypothetical protein
MDRKSSLIKKYREVSIEIMHKTGMTIRVLTKLGHATNHTRSIRLQASECHGFAGPKASRLARDLIGPCVVRGLAKRTPHEIAGCIFLSHLVHLANHHNRQSIFLR